MHKTHFGMFFIAPRDPAIHTQRIESTLKIVMRTKSFNELPVNARIVKSAKFYSHVTWKLTHLEEVKGKRTRQG